MTTTLTAAAGPINSSASVTSTPTNDRFNTNAVLAIKNSVASAKTIDVGYFYMRGEVSR